MGNMELFDKLPYRPQSLRITQVESPFLNTKVVLSYLIMHFAKVESPRGVPQETP